MARRFFPAPFLAALLLVSGPCLAFQAGSARLETVLSDRRFEREVTLRLSKRPLSEVVAVLAEQTGAPLSAADDVADEPAVVYVTKRPAREVMRALALHFDYRWRRTGTPGSYRYQLYQDLRSKRQEEALRLQERLRALERLHAALRQRVELARRPPDELLRLADRFDEVRQGRHMPAPREREELERRPEWQLMRRAGGSNLLREAAGGHWPVLVQVAAALAPEQWEELLAGRTLGFGTREEPGTRLLPMPVADALRAARPTQFPPGTRLVFANPDTEFAFARMEEMLANQWQRATGFRLVFRLQQAKQGDSASVKLQVGVRTELPAMELGGQQHMHAGSLEVSSDEASPITAPAEKEPTVDGPVFQRKRRWTPDLPPGDLRIVTHNTLNHVLYRMAEVYEVDLIADAYRHPRMFPPEWSSTHEPSLGEVLDTWVRSVARWRQDGEILLIRRRTWYLDRLAEIPQRYAARLAEELRKQPLLSTDRQAEIVLSLRDEQIPHLPAVLREHGIDLGNSAEWLHNFRGLRELLRAIGSLTPLQQRRLRDGDALRLAEMPPPARDWLLTGLLAGDKDAETDPNPQLTIPTARLRAIRCRRVVSRAPMGFTVEYLAPPPQAGLPPMGLARFPVPGDAPLAPGEEEVTDVAFAYEYGSAVRFFQIPPLFVRVLPPPAEQDGGVGGAHSFRLAR